MTQKKSLRLLFIGNSLTYVKDVPELVAERFRQEGIACDAVMLAHAAWFLRQHVKSPDVRFNIRYGHYDYIVIQEHSHPFAEEDEYLEAVRTLDEWIREAGARTVIYGTWALQDEPEKQPEMDRLHRKAAELTGAVLVPVGEHWWEYQAQHPKLTLYCHDREHASAAGAALAADYLWQGIRQDLAQAQE